MTATYSEMFTAATRLDFYANKITARYSVLPVPDVSFVPSAATRVLMRRMDMLLRTNAAGSSFTLLVATNGTAGSNKLLRFPARKADTLHFFIQLQNAALPNFSDVPADMKADELFYGSNDIATVVPGRTNLSLSKGSKVNAADDLVKRCDGVFRYAGASISDTVVIRHQYTAVEMSPSGMVNEAGRAFLIFKLDAMPEGLYQVFINGVVTTDRFYYVGANAPKHILGVLVFYLDASIPEKYRIVELNQSLTPERPQYLLSFNSRKTTWRYTLQLEPGTELYKEFAAIVNPADRKTFFKITCNDTGISFTQQSATDTIVVMQTTTVLSLQEQYISGSAATALSLALEKNGGTVLKKNLPQPASGIVDARIPPEIYSDIFITL